MKYDKEKKNKHITWHITRSQYKFVKDTDPHKYGQLICNKGAKAFQWRKASLVNKCCWNNYTSIFKKKKKKKILDLNLTP